MAIQTDNYLKSKFEDLDQPTGQDFADLVDTKAHRTTDFDKMGGGLKEHSGLRPYKAGEAVLRNGSIWISDLDQQGAFSDSTWTPFDNGVGQLGIPKYDYDKTDYELDDQMTYKGQIWRAIWTDDEFGGIAPDDPEGPDYWEAEVFTEGGKIPLVPSGGFVKNDRVYSYQGEDASKGFYRTNRSDPGFDGGFKSTNFATELANEDWVLEASLSGGSITIDSDPTESSSNAVASGGVYSALQTRLKIAGPNYYILQPTGVPLDDGVLLVAAYTAVAALGIPGSKLFLMPGTYDLGDQTITGNENATIEGFSSDASVTVITATNHVASQALFDYTSADFGLSNLTVVSDIANSGKCFDGNNFKLTLRNVRIGGSLDFSKLTGDWKDIVILSTCDNFLAGEIYGRYVNIYCEDGIAELFKSSGPLQGYFENIEAGDILGEAFTAGADIDMTVFGFFQRTGTTIGTLLTCVGTVFSGHLSNLLIEDSGSDVLVGGSGCVYTGLLIENSTIKTAGLTLGFNGYLRSCTIYSEVDVDAGAKIERCKIISTANPSIATSALAPACQIIYTATNYPINPAISVPVVNFNIEDSSLV